MIEHDSSKRRFVKAAAYIAPVILTLKVTPTFASGGSGRGNGNPGAPGEEFNPSEQSPAAPSSSKKKRRWYWPFA